MVQEGEDIQGTLLDHWLTGGSGEETLLLGHTQLTGNIIISFLCEHLSAVRCGEISWAIWNLNLQFTNGTLAHWWAEKLSEENMTNWSDLSVLISWILHQVKNNQISFPMLQKWLLLRTCNDWREGQCPGDLQNALVCPWSTKVSLH